jgi:hypothetical protein
MSYPSCRRTNELAELKQKLLPKDHVGITGRSTIVGVQGGVSTRLHRRKFPCSDRGILKRIPPTTTRKTLQYRITGPVLSPCGMNIFNCICFAFMGIFTASLKGYLRSLVQRHDYGLNPNMNRLIQKRWSLMFVGAAIFNFLIGIPIFLTPGWSYNLAYVGDSSDSTLRFWSDFGFAVILIGIGYAIIAFDVSKNRGIVWLGIFAKLFDVVTITWRWAHGIVRALARALALAPATVDGLFIILFFRVSLHRRSAWMNPKGHRTHLADKPL